MQGVNFIFLIAILILSVVAHEVSHGFVAYLLGDPTAKRAEALYEPAQTLGYDGVFYRAVDVDFIKVIFCFRLGQAGAV